MDRDVKDRDVKDRDAKDRDAKDRDAKDRDGKDRDAKDRSRSERGWPTRSAAPAGGDAHKNHCCPCRGAGSSFLFFLRVPVC